MAIRTLTILLVISALVVSSPLSLANGVHGPGEEHPVTQQKRESGASPAVVVGLGVLGAAAVGFFVFTRMRKKP